MFSKKIARLIALGSLAAVVGACSGYHIVPAEGGFVIEPEPPRICFSSGLESIAPSPATVRLRNQDCLENTNYSAQTDEANRLAIKKECYVASLALVTHVPRDSDRPSCLEFQDVPSHPSRDYRNYLYWYNHRDDPYEDDD